MFSENLRVIIIVGGLALIALGLYIRHRKTVKLNKRFHFWKGAFMCIDQSVRSKYPQLSVLETYPEKTDRRPHFVWRWRLGFEGIPPLYFELSSGHDYLLVYRESLTRGTFAVRYSWDSLGLLYNKDTLAALYVDHALSGRIMAQIEAHIDANAPAFNK